MKSLYLRIYATLVVVLLLFALVAGWLFSRSVEHRRAEGEAEMSERVEAWGDLASSNLPAATAPLSEQRDAVMDWSTRLGLPMALEDSDGKRIGTSASFTREEERRGAISRGRFGTVELPLVDGRRLRVLIMHGPPPRMRPRSEDSAASASGSGSVSGSVSGGPAVVGSLGEPQARASDDRQAFERRRSERGDDFGGDRARSGEPGRGFGADGPGGSGANAAFRDGSRPPPREFDGRGPGGPGFGFGGPVFGPGDGPRPGPPSPWWFANTENLVAALVLVFIAVAAGAWPVVRRLTRRLELLKQGVEAFGKGALDQRVHVDGKDEVAALAVSFNETAQQIETLIRSHQSLLANASHELRSPLARMKMALSLLDLAPEDQRRLLKSEINTNIAELDSLVEEVLLASRLDAADSIERCDKVDLLAIAAEEANRTSASAQGESVVVAGNERLLRRALRNLLENARRYGGGDVIVDVTAKGGEAVVRVCDRGPGVPAELKERIFEPFYRLPGHAEQAGGVGLGLSLVRQIAERHGGSVHWESREGGGSCFVISVPLQPATV